MAKAQKFGTCFWFDTQALEAAEFYTSIFDNSAIKSVTHYTKSGPMAEGAVLTVTLDLDGAEFTFLNGGPVFTQSEAASILVRCSDQAEIDRYWTALLEGGGKESQCGWLKDRYGVSWQIAWQGLLEVLETAGPETRERGMSAMMKMVKLDVAKLEAAIAE
jgi:predicted 3-demethylubiquinone-9 3-methyltransferase (glyoxalase superfamily)